MGTCGSYGAAEEGYAECKAVDSLNEAEAAGDCVGGAGLTNARRLVTQVKRMDGTR